MKDLRCRYFYKLMDKNNKIIFEGFLLHEEAWAALRGNNEICKASFLNNKTKLQSDKLIIL